MPSRSAARIWLRINESSGLISRAGPAPASRRMRAVRVKLARHAMATRFELLLHGQDPVLLRAAGEEALREIDSLEAQLSLYRRSSEIAHLNARAATEPVRVSPTLFALLEQARGL